MFSTWLRSPFAWILSLAFFVGIFLRFQNFGDIPVSLYWDEMAIWNEAQSIAQTGRDTHNRVWNQAIYISYGDYKMPAYIWLTSLVTYFVSDPLPGVRVVGLIASLSLLLSVPWLMWELQKIFVSIRGRVVSSHSSGSQLLLPALTGVMVAIAPVTLHFSRVGFEAHLGLSFLVLSIATALHGWKKKSTWSVSFFLVLSACLAALATYSYFSVRFVWPAILLVFLSWMVWQAPTWRQRFISGLSGVLALVLWVALLTPLFTADFSAESNRFRLSTPSILNDETLLHRVNQSRLLSGNSIVSRVIFSSRLEQAKQLWQHGLSFTNVEYLFMQGDSYLRHGTGSTGLFWWWMAPLIVIGFIGLWRRSPVLSSILLVWWAFGVLPAAVPNDVPHLLRSLNALPPQFIWMAFGAVLILEWSQRRFSSWRTVVNGILSLGLAGLILLSAMQWSAQQPLYAQKSGSDWQEGYIPLAQYLGSVQSKYDQILVESFDARFFVYYQPFSGLAWSEIQQMPTESFARKEFGSVQLEVTDPLSLAQSGDLVILKAGRDVPPGFVVQQRIMNLSGEEVFLAVEAPQI